MALDEQDHDVVHTNCLHELPVAMAPSPRTPMLTTPNSSAASARSIRPAETAAAHIVTRIASTGSVALIELLRGVAAFRAGPLLLHMSKTVGASAAAGIESAIWIAFGIALVGSAVAISIWVLGRARPQRPAIEPWLKGERPAIESPPVGRPTRP